MGVNKVIIMGNVGREPVVRQIGEKTVANFSVATTDRRFKDRDGKPSTEWHNVTAWGKLADIVSQYVTKGMQVYIEGRLQTRSWEKDGQKHYATEVIADQMEMLSRHRDSAAGPGPTPAPVAEGDWMEGEAF
jgi:single-strand DNA-binding protein